MAGEQKIVGFPTGIVVYGIKVECFLLVSAGGGALIEPQFDLSFNELFIILALGL